VTLTDAPACLWRYTSGFGILREYLPAINPRLEFVSTVDLPVSERFDQRCDDSGLAITWTHRRPDPEVERFCVILREADFVFPLTRRRQDCQGNAQSDAGNADPAIISAVKTVAMSLRNTVRSRMPKAQIPAVTFHSVRLGEYSTIS